MAVTRYAQSVDTCDYRHNLIAMSKQISSECVAHVSRVIKHRKNAALLPIRCRILRETSTFAKDNNCTEHDDNVPNDIDQETRIYERIVNVSRYIRNLTIYPISYDAIRSHLAIRRRAITYFLFFYSNLRVIINNNKLH